MDKATPATPESTETAPSSAPATEPGFLASYASSGRHNFLSQPSVAAPAEPAEPDPLGVASQRARLSKLGFGDVSSNAINELIRGSERDVRRDPALWSVMQQCQDLHAQLAEHEAAGDALKAASTRIEISKLERKLQKAFYDRVSARSGKG
jgi:hypothetical protein